MRIIAGINRGRRLEQPTGSRVRPTGDKVKEAMFSAIQGYLTDGVVCDLFGGTGNLGLEALSRGAEYCFFSDISRDSIKLIKENIKLCKVSDKVAVIQGDYKRALDQIPQKIDVFFLDPPYGDNLLEDAITIIGEKKLLTEAGVIVAEHSKDTILPEEIGGLKKIKEKVYGFVVLSFFIC